MAVTITVRAKDPDLTAIEGLAGTSGGLFKTAANAWALRTLTVSGTGLSVADGDGVSGAPTFSLSAALSTIGGLTPAADRVPYFTGASGAALATLTAFGRTLIAVATAAAARSATGAAGLTDANSFSAKQTVTGLAAGVSTTLLELENASNTTGTTARLLLNPSTTPNAGAAVDGVRKASGGIGITGSVIDSGGTLQPAFVFDEASRLDLPGVYAETTGSAANVFIDTDGSLRRSTSSLKYKENIEDYVPPASIDLLRPVFFTQKGDPSGRVYAGLIAEEMHAAGFVEFVLYADGEPDALHYPNMVALLVNEVKALRARVTALEGA